MGVMKRLYERQKLGGQKSAAYLELVLENNRLAMAVDAKRRKVLYQTAAYAKTTMQRSMRPAPKKARDASKERPPYTHLTKHGHSGELRRLIGFQISEKEGSLAVGPAIAEFRSHTVPVSASTVPELLDQGGPAHLPQGFATFRAFPFVGPAFEKTLPKFIERIARLPLTARS